MIIIHVFINPKFTVNVLFLIYPNTIIYIYIYIHNTYLFILRVYFEHLFTFVLCSNFEILIIFLYIYYLFIQWYWWFDFRECSIFWAFRLQILKTFLCSHCAKTRFIFSVWFWIRSLPPFVLPTAIFDVLASRANSKHWRETCEWVWLSSSYNLI